MPLDYITLKDVTNSDNDNPRNVSLCISSSSVKLLGRLSHTTELSIDKENAIELVNLLMARVILADEKSQTKKGEQLAQLLHLRRKRDNKRFNTCYGDKTALGLYRTIARFMLEDSI